MDYRDLSKKKRPDNCPLPKTDNFLDQLVISHCLSSIYLHSGYHWVEIRP